ncbi:hypothetical protein HJ581_0001040 (plasmid) [Rhodococcus opacus]|uniref:hypothetical protein n=1 Tax=Rhodococcus opacus TaxID=37919 RepID=UPI0029561B02|nr:hypothetical protein [Rhodococcus opacus]WKN52540.1 hypothetical protein HJ581_0001040 [Rhodococcus opacus]
MARRTHRPTSCWVSCPHCGGKRTYFTRRAARAARTHHEQRQGLAICPCPHRHQDGEVGFHVGHRPEGLGRGHIDRDTLADNQRAALPAGPSAVGGAR